MTSPRGTPAAAAHPTAVIVALSTAGLVSSVMMTLIIPLIPELGLLLSAAPTDASWAVTATLLAGAVCMPVSGRLGDMFGKRGVIVAVLGLLITGSVISALSSSLTPMIVGRALQGAAISAVPLGISLMRDLLPADRLGSAVAFMSATLGVGGTIALPMGALIAQHADWHALFWASAGLGVLSVTLIVALVPRAGRGSGGRFDVVGAVGLSTALICLLVPISKGTAWGWTDPLTLGLFAAAAIVFSGWVLLELRVRSPLVDLRVSIRRPVLATNLASVMVGFALYASSILMTQLLQTPRTPGGVGLGASLVVAGCAMAPSGAVMIVLAPVSARLSTARGPRTTLLVGSAIIAVGYLMALFLMSSVWQVIVSSTVIGAGVALAYAAMPTLIMSAVPDTETAAANGLNSLMRSLGISVAGAVMGALLASTGHAAASAHVYRLAFLVAAAAAVVAVLVTLVVPRPGRTAPAAVTSRRRAGPHPVAAAPLAGTSLRSSTRSE